MSRKRKPKRKRRRNTTPPEDKEVKKEKLKLWASIFGFAGYVVRLFL